MLEIEEVNEAIRKVFKKCMDYILNTPLKDTDVIKNITAHLNTERLQIDYYLIKFYF